jgi:hypothetical protein
MMSGDLQIVNLGRFEGIMEFLRLMAERSADDGDGLNVEGKVPRELPWKHCPFCGIDLPDAPDG